MKTLKFKTIDSTNSYLKRAYKETFDFTWITSEIQTHGKGRMHHKWIGSKDCLMCSTILKKDITVTNLSLYPLLAAVSLHKVLSKYHQELMIKWPNDIYLGDKKLAGILCESIIEANDVQAIIIGFGINLNQTNFPDDIKDTATSLYLHTNHKYHKTKILKKLINQLKIDLRSFLTNPSVIIDYCNTYNYLKDLTISYIESNQTHEAQVIDINQNGHLNVLVDKTIISLHSGEVSLLKV